MAKESRYLLNIYSCSPSRLFLVNVIVLQIQHHPWDSTDHPFFLTNYPLFFFFVTDQ
ncbi:unnamed protein product [Brassica rapa subsp. narinosa]